MGLMDKVKAQTAQAAQKAQEVSRAGQAKLEETQAKRKLDAMFRDLGASVYAERTGRPGADPSVSARLIDDIRAFEAEHGAKVMSTEPTAGQDPGAGGGFS